MKSGMKENSAKTTRRYGMVSMMFLSVYLSMAGAALAQGVLSASGQRPSGASSPTASVTVTAAADGERVRITAFPSVVQMRVEVYAPGGEKVVDQEIRGGNVFDWHLQNGQGALVPAGNYTCVVTTKGIAGRLTQKVGSITVADKSATASALDLQQLSPVQAQTIGPLEENSSWTIAGRDEPQTPTVIAHDGNDGQMIRGRGALTFRLGNFFTGLDQEQMRLTEEGNLGIGTSNPQAKLEVAGTIRAQRFLMAKPKATSDDKTTTATGTSADSTDIEPLVAGTGTQDRIAKWTDNAGTLGDSGITETGGFVGIGTTSPGSKLVVSSNSAILPPASGIARFAEADGVQTGVFADSFGTNPFFNVRRANGTAAAPSALHANQLIGVIGASGYGASTYMGTRARVAFSASENWSDTANGTYLTFNTTANGTNTPGGTERVRIDNAGNVGIGTPNPTHPLHVNGNGFFTGNVAGAQFNIGSSRVLSAPGNSTYVGLNSGLSATGASNSFFGQAAGEATTTGSTNSFFGATSGQSNTTGSANSFFGVGSGTDNIGGSDNAFFGVNTGRGNTSGNENSYFGRLAGRNTTTGSKNSMFGMSAGTANVVGTNLTIIGADADVGFNNLTNATAIGANARVSQSNSLVLGSIDGVNGATADTNVGIGTTSPSQRLDVSGNIRVSGKINRPSTGSANLVPICYGNVDEDGSVGGGSGNFTAVRVDTGFYQITIENQVFDDRVDTALITVHGVSTAFIPSFGSTANKVNVYIHNTLSQRVDKRFSFVVYKQ